MIDPGFMWLLELILFLITGGLLYIFKFDILQPSVLMSASMMLSVFLAAVNTERWQLEFSMTSVLILSLGVLAFATGSLTVTKNIYKNAIPKKLPKSIYYNCGAAIYFSMIIMISLAILSFHEIYSLSKTLGNTEGIFNIIKTVRPAIEFQSLKLSRWMYYRQYIAMGISYVYAYMFLNNIIYFKWSNKNIILLCPIILYVPFMIFTTGRMSMISFFIYFVTIGIFLYLKKYYFSLKHNIKAILGLTLLSSLAVIFFLVMGALSGKTTTDTRTPFVIISHYLGLSVPAFDSAYNSVGVENNLIGSHLFVSIYRILNFAGFNFPDVEIFLPFTEFNGINTNVYTAEWRYVKDFGITGMMAIMWLLGGFYSSFYNWLKYSETGIYSLLLYGTISYPLFLSSIDERFFLDLFGSSIIYIALALLLAKKILIDKRK